MKRIALALAVAVISTGATAQSTAPILPSKVIEIAPAGTSTAAPVPGRSAQAGCKGWNCGAEPIRESGNTTRPAASVAKQLLDGCVIEAIGRLPKVDGLRITDTSYEFLEFNGVWDLWTVFVSVDLNGRRANYQWRCGTRANTAKLFP